MSRTPATFGEFYAAYLAAHRHPANRALHLLAKLALLAVIVVAAIRREPLWLLALPVVAVAPCWLGHFLFEGNRPTSWTRPAASLLGALRAPFERRRTTAAEPHGERRYWSFFADLRMCAAMLGLGSRVDPASRPDENEPT
jgi:hypothetical protein